MLLTLHRLGISTSKVFALLVLTRLRISSTAGNAETINALPCLSTSSRNESVVASACPQYLSEKILDSGFSLLTQSLAHLCLPGGPAQCWTLTRENQNHCLQQIRSEAAFNAACRDELEAQQQWLGYREAKAAKSSISCCLAQDAECDCKATLAEAAARMPEDWAQEANLVQECSASIDMHCPDVIPGQARLYICLEQNSHKPGFKCNLPPIGGRSRVAIGQDSELDSLCKVAVISTYTPKNCGLATFTHALMQELRVSKGLPQGCHVGVIALSDPADELLYRDPIVEYDLRYDLDTPSVSILEAVHFMHKASYTHVIIQQEFGLMPIMWQLADLARWLDPVIKVYTVVHNPKAAPNIEERGILRAMSQVSHGMIVMTWFGWHSLIAAYGIAPEKVIFIPHGVVLPQSTERSTPDRHLLEQISLRRLCSSTNASLELPANAQLVISNGLFTHHKRLDRIIAAMGRVLESHPATYFLLLGREHPSEPLAGRLMKNIIDQAKSAGVANRLLWVDGFQTTEALSSLLMCSAAFLATFDEQSPTSGTLLMAMAHGLPIVSTPTHHALELLYNSRGFLVHYDDNGTALADMLNALLENGSLRSMMGARAQQMVHGWTWQSVAMQYAQLISEGNITPLGKDPFINAHPMEPSATWHGQAIKFLNGHELSAGSSLKGSMHALFIDIDIQVNAAVSDSGELTSLGIFMQQWWLMMNHHVGIDVEFNPAEVPDGSWPEDSGLSIDLENMSIAAQSRNAAVHAKLVPGGSVKLEIILTDRFAVPEGLLGHSYSNPLDLPRPQEKQTSDTDNWTQWILSDQNLFSTDAPGQRWEFKFRSTIRSNIRLLPEHRLQRGTYDGQRQQGQLTIPFRMEADVFGNSGIAQVNQRYWLQLRRGIELQGRHYTFEMCLVPQYLPKEESVETMGVLEHLIHAAYRGQGNCTDEPPVISRWPGILFRFQWPPNFMQPLPGYRYIHQQDFEFDGMPKAWLHPMNDVVDELWVPSLFNKDIFIGDGVSESKVKVLPHGIELTKYQPATRPLHLPFNRSSVFLFNGGLLPRKGIDILLQAFTEAFQPSDDVALIVHSSYGDNFWERQLQDAMRNSSGPSVFFFQTSLSHAEMLRLYRSANVYVSSFRSEGFGLGTLEALALGLQVLITDSGPAREICPRELQACTLVESMAAECFIAPCNRSSLFGEESVHQPAWSEPSKQSLVVQLRQLHAAKQWPALTQRSAAEQASAHVRHWTWYNAGTSMLQRCRALLED